MTGPYPPQFPPASFTTTFYDANGNALPEWCDGQVLPVLHKGDGVVTSKAGRFRVVDAWISFDFRGNFGVGWHVFLEPVSENDDRLRKLAPTYFADEQ